MCNKEIIEKLEDTKSFIVGTVGSTHAEVQDYINIIDTAIQRLYLLSEVTNKYLDICHDCKGRPPFGNMTIMCPFYIPPYVDEDRRAVPCGCKLCNI